MSTTTTLGQYQFEAWARRGIAASLNNPDSGSLPSRASLNVQLLLNVQGGSAPNPVQPTATTVNLFGPGDVVGIDPRMVIRTEPRQFTVNFEPNYLCGIEFDTPDFPWLFTPAAPNGDQLHPWVALIVLKQGSEFSLPSTAPNPLPTVIVNTMAALQDLSTSGKCNFAAALPAAARSRNFLYSISGSRISERRAGRTWSGCFISDNFRSGLDPEHTSPADCAVLLPLRFQHQRRRRFRIAGARPDAARTAGNGGAAADGRESAGSVDSRGRPAAAGVKP